MLSDFAKKKHSRAFNIYFDRDGDGIVTFEDYIANILYVKKNEGWGDADPQWMELLNVKKKSWEVLKTNVGATDSDQVTLAQWLSFSEKMQNETKASGKPPQWMVDVFRTIFQSIDLNGDGDISLEEFTIHLKSIDSDCDPAETFNKADLNGDGVLNPNELDQLIVEWWTSEDPEGAGNIFFIGKVD